MTTTPPITMAMSKLESESEGVVFTSESEGVVFTSCLRLLSFGGEVEVVEGMGGGGVTVGRV